MERYYNNAEFERTRSEKQNGTILESASYVAARSLQKLGKVIHSKEPYTEQQKYRKFIRKSRMRSLRSCDHFQETDLAYINERGYL